MYSSSREVQYGEIFGGTIQEIIGCGSNGRTKVYLLVQKRNKKYYSALKVIPIIAEYKKKLLCSEDYIKEYENERIRLCIEAEKEVQIMDELKGCPNLVYYEEFQFKNWETENAFGCDMLIKMPRFESIFDLIKSGYSFSESEIIKIGKDICTALINCHRVNILHRDIKAENIFRNEHGVYLLGDFGISRILNKTQMASTGIGTFQYAAPEQVRLEKYDKLVDIYSLGLTLYVLGNENKLPFANKYSIAWNSIEIVKRIQGEKLPVPTKCGTALSNVILKACSFRKEERFQNAEEFFEALDDVSYSISKNNIKLQFDTKFESDNFMSAYYDEIDMYETQFANSGTATADKDNLGMLNIDLIKQMAEHGKASAQFMLAEYYHDGINIEKNYDKAVEWYKKAVLQNNSAAQFGLGVCYMHGQGVRKDIYEAVKLFMKAAEQGYFPAIYYIGECYYCGYNAIGIDYVEAAEYFRRVAEQGIAIAQVRLGDCYLEGHGVEKSRNKAIIWYKAAADQGDTDAKLRLKELNVEL